MATATVAPWVVTADSQNSYSLISPGYNGTSSAFMGVDNQNPNGPYSNVMLTTNVSFIINASYTFGLAYKFSANEGGCYLNAFLDGNYIFSLTPSGNTAAVGNWAFSTGATITASKCTSVLQIYFTCTAYESMTYYIDDVQFIHNSLPANVPTCAASTTSTATSLRLVQASLL